MLYTDRLTRLAVFTLSSFLVSACAVPDESLDASALEDETVGEAKQAVCSGDNLDEHATCNQCTTGITAYANEFGWTRYWFPSQTQLHCEFPIDDYRMYWNNSVVANTANQTTIRLRYQGPGGTTSCCAKPSYAADYLTENGTDYLRVTLSSNPGGFCLCNSTDYVMVAP